MWLVAIITQRRVHSVIVSNTTVTLELTSIARVKGEEMKTCI